MTIPWCRTDGPMNKKLTVRTEHGKLRRCILSGDEDLQVQLARLLAIRPGCGFSVELYPDQVKIVDYFHGETRGNLQILAFEDSDLPVTPDWVDLPEG